MYKFSFEKEITYILVLFLPVFALIDWHITEITNYKSKNLIRTLSGFLLGIAYSLGLLAFIKNFQILLMKNGKLPLILMLADIF